MKLLIFIRSLFSYILFGIACFIIVPPALIILLLPEKYRYENKLFFFIAYLFYKTVLYTSFLPIKIKGQENINKNQPCIIVANHQSALDIPLIGYICNGYPHVWFVLEYYLNKPILGFFIKKMFVSVDRSSPSKAARSLIKLISFAKNNSCNIIIFPEGKRSIDGEIHEFFKGFYVISKKTGYPIVPIYMPNNGKIYPPYSFLIYNYPIKATIGKPFLLQDGESDEQFTQRVRNWFVQESKQEPKKK